MRVWRNGRREGLKHPYLTVCRFESDHPHQYQDFLTALALPFRGGWIGARHMVAGQALGRLQAPLRGVDSTELAAWGGCKLPVIIVPVPD